MLGMLDFVVTDKHLADFAVMPRPFTCKHVGLAVLGGVTGDVGPADVANRKLPGVVDRDSLGPSFGIDDPYPFCVFNPVFLLR